MNRLSQEHHLFAIPVDISRPAHRYTVYVGDTLSRNLAQDIETRFSATGYLLVIDENVAEKHLLDKRVEGRERWTCVRVEAGEENKTLDTYSRLFGAALDAGLDRGSMIVAVGGGVVGDVAGFVAATYMRGIRLVQIPTTLLAQVDSSVGGKTGINHAGGKNLMGAFHQPVMVMADPAFLQTLPDREYRAGLAEVVKYGVLGDREFFQQLIANASRLLARDTGLLARVVAHCCRMKAEVVAADEVERGKRGLLNLGHTFGHALESLAGYDGSVVHGEAVSVGMAMAARFAMERGLLPESELDDLLQGMRALQLPVVLDQLGKGDAFWREAVTLEPVSAALLKDKKSASGQLTLIVPHSIGDCRLTGRIPVSEAADLMVRMASNECGKKN